MLLNNLPVFVLGRNLCFDIKNVKQRGDFASGMDEALIGQGRLRQRQVNCRGIDDMKGLYRILGGKRKAP